MYACTWVTQTTHSHNTCTHTHNTYSQHTRHTRHTHTQYIHTIITIITITLSTTCGWNRPCVVNNSYTLRTRRTHYIISMYPLTNISITITIISYRSHINVCIYCVIGLLDGLGYYHVHIWRTEIQELYLTPRSHKRDLEWILQFWKRKRW